MTQFAQLMGGSPTGFQTATMTIGSFGPNQQEDYPERTGIGVRTERYCDRSGRRSASRNPAPPASRPLRGFGGGGTRRRQPNGGFREIDRYPIGAAVGG